MKWYGYIGYEQQILTEPGVWEGKIIEKPYYGDVLKLTKSDQSAQSINNDFAVNNQISVLSDPFLIENFSSIVYITFMGVKWRPNSVDVDYPRIRLTLGDVYREEGVKENA